MKLNKRFIISSSSFKGEEMPDKEPVYGFKLNKKGQQEFGIVSYQDIAEERKSYLECCDFKTLYNSICPPMNAFDRMADYMEQFQHLDFEDPIVCANYVDQLKRDFFTLPEEIRRKYDNNLNTFTTAVYNGDFDNFLNSEFFEEENKSQVADKEPEKDRPLSVDELNRIRNILNGDSATNDVTAGKNKGD